MPKRIGACKPVTRSCASLPVKRLKLYQFATCCYHESNRQISKFEQKFASSQRDVRYSMTISRFARFFGYALCPILFRTKLLSAKKNVDRQIAELNKDFVPCKLKQEG